MGEPDTACPQCGFLNEFDEPRCVKCGARLRDLADAPFDRRPYSSTIVWACRIGLIGPIGWLLLCLLEYLSPPYELFFAAFIMLFGLMTILIAFIAGIRVIVIDHDYKRWFVRNGAAVVGVLSCLITILLFMQHTPIFHARPHTCGGSRVKSDQRTLSTALEAYYIDFNSYPAWSLKPELSINGESFKQDMTMRLVPSFRIKRDDTDHLYTLTSPISYISSYFPDPFAPVKGCTYGYWTPEKGEGWIMWSPGPDGEYDLTIANIAKAYEPGGEVPNAYLINRTYDPSNGATSAGDVYRYKQ